MLTRFALPFTTLTESVEVAAETIGLESFELDICLPWWHAKMAQCLLRMFVQGTETVHVWTSKLVCLYIFSLFYNMLLAGVIRSLFSLITAIDCTKPEAEHVLGYWIWGCLADSFLPQTFTLYLAKHRHSQIAALLCGPGSPVAFMIW